MNEQDKQAPAGAIQGEGNYDASRRFDAAEQEFIEKNPEEIAKAAKVAAQALDGPEGEELKAAEATSRARGAGMDSR